MDALTIRLKSVIREKLSDADVFGLIFDGWSDGASHHILAVFCQCPFGTYLLGHRQLLTITNQGANNIAHTIRSIIAEYDLNLDNLAYVVSDNTNVNPAVAETLHVPLIGCASHKFNLAVKRYIKHNFQSVVDKVAAMCIEMRKSNNAGQLNKFTSLKALGYNETRWSSVYTMIARYKEIHQFITAENFPSLVKKMLSPSENSEVDQFLVNLIKFESITRELQRENLTVLEARCLFNRVMQDYPEMSYYLSQNASIIHDKDFDNALVAIMDATEHNLSVKQVQLVKQFEKPISDISENDDSGNNTTESYAKDILNSAKKAKVDGTHNYIDMSFINPTSNIVERLFSQSKLYFNDKRKRMKTTRLEDTLFLHYHKELWTSKDIANIDMNANISLQEIDDSDLESICSEKNDCDITIIDDYSNQNIASTTSSSSSNI